MGRKISKKRKSKNVKRCIIGKRIQDDTLMLVDEIAGQPADSNAPPQTSSERHRLEVQKKRELKKEKAFIKLRRLRLPKSSKESRRERKELTAKLKALSIPQTEGAQEDAKAKPPVAADADTEMKPRQTFKYVVNIKAARRAVRRKQLRDADVVVPHVGMIPER